MYRYNTITSDAGEVELVKLHSNIWIEFKEVMNKEYPTQTLVWDNEDFIFGKFYRFLIRYKCNKLKKNDKKKYDDVWSILNQDVVSELIDMLEFALERDWYELKK